MSFKPKRIVEPDEPVRPSSAELAAAIGPLASNLIPTAPAPPAPPAPTPAAMAPAPKPAAEPVLMMSFKASNTDSLKS